MQSRRAPASHAWIWAVGAARDSAVGAVRRHLGTSIDARADYYFDPGASTKAASTRCALVFGVWGGEIVGLGRMWSLPYDFPSLRCLPTGCCCAHRIAMTLRLFPPPDGTTNSSRGTDTRCLIPLRITVVDHETHADRLAGVRLELAIVERGAPVGSVVLADIAHATRRSVTGCSHRT
jgi:hypothetical protein